MHPYTEALLSAIPTTDIEDKRKLFFLKEIYQVQLILLQVVSSIQDVNITDICKTVVPEFEEASPGHFVACHQA